MLVVTKSPEQVREARAAAYLDRFSVADQLEALTEAAAGRPAKLDALLAGIAAIKAAHPKPHQEPE